MLWGNPVMDQPPVQGRVEILPGASCYRDWRVLGPLGANHLAHNNFVLHESPTLLFQKYLKAVGFDCDWGKHLE